MSRTDTPHDAHANTRKHFGHLKLRTFSPAWVVFAGLHQRICSGSEMKNRATVLCVRDNRILLVARERSRWSLPGGRISRGEAAHEAARRELEEETTLAADNLMYLFQFDGFGTRHHVFFADVDEHAVAYPSNEIARCKWFTPVKIGTLSASVPTRGIVGLFFEHIGAQTPDSFPEAITWPSVTNV